MIFDTRVNGIPCQCNVTFYSPAVPMRITGSGQGDADPPEDSEFDFEILDRRNRKAPWLERYVTPEVVDRLHEEFLFANKAQDYGIY